MRYVFRFMKKMWHCVLHLLIFIAAFCFKLLIWRVIVLKCGGVVQKISRVEQGNARRKEGRCLVLFVTPSWIIYPSEFVVRATELSWAVISSSRRTSWMLSSLHWLVTIRILHGQFLINVLFLYRKYELLLLSRFVSSPLPFAQTFTMRVWERFSVVGFQEHVYVSLSVDSHSLSLYFSHYIFVLSCLHLSLVLAFLCFIIWIVTLWTLFAFEAYPLQCIYFMLIIIKRKTVYRFLFLSVSVLVPQRSQLSVVGSVGWLHC